MAGKFDCFVIVQAFGGYAIAAEDPTTAHVTLANKVFALHRDNFRCASGMDAAAKATLSRHPRSEPRFWYALLCAFYQEAGLEEKIDIAERMLPLVFPNK